MRNRARSEGNARLPRLRALVPVTSAIAGIDLAGSKQMVVVTDHDSKVIARRVLASPHGEATCSVRVLSGVAVADVSNWLTLSRNCRNYQSGTGAL